MTLEYEVLGETIQGLTAVDITCPQCHLPIACVCEFDSEYSPDINVHPGWVCGVADHSEDDHPDAYDRCQCDHVEAALDAMVSDLGYQMTKDRM